MWNKNHIYWLLVAVLWMVDNICRQRLSILYDIITCMVFNSLFYYSLDDGNLLTLIKKSYLLPFGVFVHSKFYHLISAAYEEGDMMFVAGFITALWFLYVPQLRTLWEYYNLGKNVIEESQKEESPINYFMNILNQTNTSSNVETKPEDGLINIFSSLASTMTRRENKDKERKKSRDYEFIPKDASSKDLHDVLELMEESDED